VKILLDECVDRRLAREIIGHEVTTVPDAGWASFQNGDLLRLAQGIYDVFITLDRISPSSSRSFALASPS
jgi:hypothetical protein